MSLPKVLITNHVPENVTKPLQGIAEVIMGESHYDPISRKEVLEIAPQLSGIINQAELKVDEELLNCSPKLKIIANVSKGTDNFDKELMASKGVWATNTPGFFAHPVAEYVLAGMLMIARRLIAADQFVKKGMWETFQPGKWDGVSLSGKKLGILGYGDIGQKLGELAKCIGMKVMYHDVNYKTSSGYVSFEELLANADVLSIHVPLNKKTKYLINSNNITKIKKGAILVNSSRGEVVEESAIIEALESEHLEGAVLDVFESEPHVNSALLSNTNVLLTPHIAGGTHESRYEARYRAFQNVAEVLKGNDPINPVNKL